MWRIMECFLSLGIMSDMDVKACKSGRKIEVWADRFCLAHELSLSCCKELSARERRIDQPASGQEVSKESSPPFQPSGGCIEACGKRPRMAFDLHRNHQQMMEQGAYTLWLNGYRQPD